MSRLYLKVVPGSSQNKIEPIEGGSYKVWVTAPPEKGKANKAVVKLLAKYFQKPKNKVAIIAGKTSKTKIIDIL